MNRLTLRLNRIGIVCALVVVPAPCAFSQDGGGSPGSVVFYSTRDTQPNNQIYLMDPDGGNQRRVIFDTASDVDPDISPNGKNIVFTSNQTGNKDIFVENLRSGAVWNLTNNPSTDEWARFSPDGKQIVFDSNRDSGVFEIFVANADGSGVPTQLTFLPASGRYPDWSPDGKQIVLKYNSDIAIINADGTGTPTQLTHENPGSLAQMAVWSPDGRHMAFMSLREGYCSVFRMNTDGSDQINLTPKDAADAPTTWCSRAPAWSTNGREIYFMSFRPSTLGQSEIFVMNMDGTNVRQLTSLGTSGEPRAR